MRKILCGTLALLLVLVALGLLPGMTTEQARPEQFALILDGVMAGWLHSGEGGHATSDVVIEKLGSDEIVRKHIAGVKYEDITLLSGTGMTKEYCDWVKASFDHKHIRKNGQLITTSDYDFKLTRGREFYDALIREVGFPALDAASKEPAYFTLTLAPTRTTVFSGKTSPPPPPPPSRKPHYFFPANFRLEIDGLDCSRVTKIDSISVKQKLVENPAGEVKDPGADIYSTEISNLKITIDSASAETWQAWFNDFVILGKNSNDREKNATLVFLDQDNKTELAKFNLKHLGIFGLHPPTPPKLCCDACSLLVPSPDPGGIRHLVADLYCEEIEALFIVPASD